MSKIFLIAGLGADTRIYNNIDLNEDEVIGVDWIKPNKTDTLKIYAQKLIFQYNITPGSIVIGNSLGGMIAVEIANIVPLKKVILISSIKTVNEVPAYFSLFHALPVYKIIPGKLIASLGFLIKPMFGKMNDADAWLFNDMLKNSSPVFIKWAMGAVLAWDNKIIPQNLYHITGDRDRVFDYRRINDAIFVKGGTHIMIFDKAKEINKILKRILKK
jgi:pimeloyl-ACP methyl ester carboxylesterase